MTIEKLWELYHFVQNADRTDEDREAVYLQCIQQDEDQDLKKLALCEYAVILYKSGLEEKRETAKKFMKYSADLGNYSALGFYGQFLLNDGDLKGVEYLCGSFVQGNLAAAKVLKDHYDVYVRNGYSTGIQTVESTINKIVNMSLESLKNGGGNNNAEFYLAVIGLYGFGNSAGIGRAEGQKYLNIAVEKGNPTAKAMARNPKLQNPDTVYSAKQSDVNYNEEIDDDDFDEEAFEREIDEIIAEDEREAAKNKFGGAEIKKSLIIGAIGALLCTLVAQMAFVPMFIAISIITAIILKIKK